MIDPQEAIIGKKELAVEKADQGFDIRSEEIVQSMETEIKPEIKAVHKNEANAMLSTKENAVVASVPPVVIAPKDAITVDLEHLLADDFTEMYLALPDDVKLEFRKKGEEIVSIIKIMIESGKVKAKKILGLLRDWLRLIPGVNIFFLEQEAKIKMDKVLKYAEDQVKSNRNII